MQPDRSCPILTIAVPLSIQQGHIARCLDSLEHPNATFQGCDLEILVIDDGSAADDSAIARERALRLEGLRVVSKPDPVHGSSIECAAEAASGTYFYVLESYDEVVPSSLRKVVALLRWLDDRGVTLDALILDRIVRDDSRRQVFTRSFRRILPAGRTFGWTEALRDPLPTSIQKPSIVFRRDLLSECHLHLPARIFHVGSLYALLPLAWARRLYHLPVPLNIHRIDRDAPSDSLHEVLDSTEEGLRLIRYMVAAFALFPKGLPKRLAAYLEDSMSVHISATLASLSLSSRDDRERKKTDLFQWIRRNYPEAYRRISRGIHVRLTRIGGRLGRVVAKSVYRIFDTQHIFEG
jgi:hypothetical protein